MKYLLLRSNERVQETIDGVIKFSIEKKKKKSEDKNSTKKKGMKKRMGIPDGISDGGSFSQCVEGPFTTSDRWWGWQRLVKIESHELVLHTRTVFLFLFLKDIGCRADL